MRRLLLVLMSLALAACASVPRPGGTADSASSAPSATPSTAATAPPYEAWARVLGRFVDDQGRVDFAALAKDRADLDQFVGYVYDVGPNNQPQLFPTTDHVLAYHINAYNALAMYKVIATGIPRSLGGFNKLGFFYFGKVQVGAQAISLYDYENKVIRALGDARIHMALNCMSVGCPRLPREPFLPQTLNAQLDREARTFFNEARNVAVNDTAMLLRLPEILAFYTGDFLAQAPTLAAYVNRYREHKVPETYALEFIPHDWTIHRQP